MEIQQDKEWWLRKNMRPSYFKRICESWQKYSKEVIKKWKEILKLKQRTKELKYSRDLWKDKYINSQKNIKKLEKDLTNKEVEILELKKNLQI